MLRPPLYDIYVGGPFCITWPTLRPGLQQARGDVIHLAIETGAVTASEVGFVLEAGPGVFWWKGLLLPDGTMFEVQDATRSSAAVIPLDQVRGAGWCSISCCGCSYSPPGGASSTVSGTSTGFPGAAGSLFTGMTTATSSEITSRGTAADRTLPGLTWAYGGSRLRGFPRS